MRVGFEKPGRRVARFPDVDVGEVVDHSMDFRLLPVLRPGVVGQVVRVDGRAVGRRAFRVGQAVHVGDC